MTVKSDINVQLWTNLGFLFFILYSTDRNYDFYLIFAFSAKLMLMHVSVMFHYSHSSWECLSFHAPSN